MAALSVVRVLAPEDASVLDSVAEGVFDHELDSRLVREFLDDPRHHLAVAILDGVVVGMASALHYVHPDKPAELWINEVGVTESARGRGFGRLLVQALLDHGQFLECRAAWVLTEPGNEAAKALYGGRGGTPEAARLFSWRLDEPPQP
ncbi:MAG: GNAT family N-acetyltransferase [Gemmatimonadetes bacterium]|nr:GNAT family N-acetyltransferase [Gemmatimonadota bacterium]NNF14903.1 GNAT family N-acetyltransferase [Gemmatimonadota bacterium]NNL30857.1 GNAT family N-acetyltransferase [Gemmatimonadota bacterium]